MHEHATADDLPETDWDTLYDAVEGFLRRRGHIDGDGIHRLYAHGDGSIAAILTTTWSPDILISGDDAFPLRGRRPVAALYEVDPDDPRPNPIASAGGQTAIVRYDASGKQSDLILYADADEAHRRWLELVAWV